MSVIAAYQDFLIRFIIDYGIPTKKPLINYANDVYSYVYHCIISKKCCVCGAKAYLHHTTRVGMGMDRKEISHIGMMAEPLCWKHHTECHTMPQNDFDEKYHICAVKIDNFIAKTYNLNTEEKNAT